MTHRRVSLAQRRRRGRESALSRVGPPERVTAKRSTRMSRLVRCLSVVAVLGLALSRPALAETHIPTGTLHGSATWTTAGSPYIVDTGYTVASDGTLTIQPG